MDNSSINIFLLILVIILAYCIIPAKEHMASTDEAIANVASLYNQQLANVTKIAIQQDATINGATTIKGPLSALGGTINTLPGKLDNNTGAGFVTNPDGTLHIAGPQLLYLLNKAGVVIGSGWGGNGNLKVEGDTSINGNVNINKSLNVGGAAKIANLGNDETVFVGNINQRKDCQGWGAKTGDGIGKQSDLYNGHQGGDGSGSCYQMCPPGSYMVGLKHGANWDWKHPLCRKYNS